MSGKPGRWANINDAIYDGDSRAFVEDSGTGSFNVVVDDVTVQTWTAAGIVLVGDLDFTGATVLLTAGAWKIDGVAVTPSAAEINVLDGVTPGTKSNNKALVVDANGRIDNIETAAIVVGVQSVSDGIVLCHGDPAGSVTGGELRLQTADDHDATIDSFKFKATSDDLTIGPNTDEDALKYDGGLNRWYFNKPLHVPTGSRITLESGCTLGSNSGATVTFDAGTTINIAASVMTATGAELSTLAGVTAGAVSASKAVVVDSNRDLDAGVGSRLRNVTIDGVFIAFGGLEVTGNIAVSGTVDGVDIASDVVVRAGTVPFTGTVGGITPVADADLSTKAYVDGSHVTLNTCGFEDASAVALSSDGGTPPTLTLTFTGTVYFWSNGIRYNKTGSDNIQITDVSGTHAIYYDGSTLTAVANPSDAQLETAIKDKALVAFIYWNTNNNTAPMLASELHGIQMSGVTHHYLHDSLGFAFDEGGAISAYTLDTASDAAISFDLGDMTLYDEDRTVDIIDGLASTQYSQVLTGDAEIPVAYRDAVDQTWVEVAASALPYLVGGNTRIQYQDKDNSFALTEVGVGKFCSYWIVATNDWQYPIKMIPGNQEYANKNDAEDNSASESLSFGDAHSEEAKILYQLVMQHSAGGTKNAKIISITDYRLSSARGSLAGLSDHGSLSGLADDDHSQYLLLAGRDAQQLTLDAEPASDHTAAGEVTALQVDTNATGIGAALYMASDGNLDESDADAAATMPVRVLALETGTGAGKKVLLRGFIRDDTWTWTVGGTIYASTTLGGMTQTAPAGSGDRVQVLGFATHADRMYFNPEYTLIVVA